MKDPIKLQPGDPCPNCTGAFVAMPLPTEDQRKRAANHENPDPLPPTVDTASVDQRADLGALYRCVNCGYRARFPLEAEARA